MTAVEQNKTTAEQNQPTVEQNKKTLEQNKGNGANKVQPSIAQTMRKIGRRLVKKDPELASKIEKRFHILVTLLERNNLEDFYLEIINAVNFEKNSLDSILPDMLLNENLSVDRRRGYAIALLHGLRNKYTDNQQNIDNQQNKDQNQEQSN